MSGTRTLMLLPCPRCGGEPTAYAARMTRDGTLLAMACAEQTCNVNTTFLPLTLDEVAARWNEGIGLTRGGVPYRQRKGQMMAVEVMEP